MRIIRLAVIGIVGVILWVTPTFAIETEAFGLDVTEQSDDGRLHIPIRAGESSTGELRMWNKQSSEIRLEVTVTAARIDDAGNAALGGDDEPVEWVSVEPASVELAPGEEQRLVVRVEAPRKLDGEVKTVAILATPAVDGEAPAVLQRLAVTTFLEPDEDSLIASLGPFPWIAAGVLLIVLALLARRMLNRRNADSSEALAPS